MIGGFLFDMAGLPLAWMLGPLVMNLIASITSVEVAVPENIRFAFLGILGLVLGSQVTPDLISRVVDWPISGGLLLIGVAISTSLCAVWFRSRGFDSVTAWFSAAPGATTAMIMMGEASGGDPRRIAISQSLRIILVLLILPPLFLFYEGSVVTDIASEQERLFLPLSDACTSTPDSIGHKAESADTGIAYAVVFLSSAIRFRCSTFPDAKLGHEHHAVGTWLCHWITVSRIVFLASEKAPL